MSWSDHEEELWQQDHRRGRLLQALFGAFVALLVVAMTVHHAAGEAALVLSLAALAGAALLGGRWHMNGNTADAFGRAARQRKADRRHKRARREQAIREGTWSPPDG